jgi:hypothetical protein
MLERVCGSRKAKITLKKHFKNSYFEVLDVLFGKLWTLDALQGGLR